MLNEYVVRDHTGRELTIYDASSNLLKQVNIYGRSLEGRYDVRWDYVQVPVEEDIDPSGYITQLQKTVIGTYYYIKDHLGNIRQTVKRDAAGSFASLRNYYPYGAVMNETVVGSTTDRYQYTGKERDKETGLDYFGARYYDSDLGVWHSVDPMADKYPGWSPYNYCLNNPLKFVDPDGRDIKMLYRKPDGDAGHIILQVVDHMSGKVKATWSFGPESSVAAIFLQDVKGHQTTDINAYLGKNKNLLQEATIETDQQTDKKVSKHIEERKKDNENYNLVSNNCGQTAVQLVTTFGSINVSTNSILPSSVFKDFLDAKKRI